MATYRTIATSETIPDAPVTSTLMIALADNPTAIAEGATGAPRLLGKAAARDSEAALPVVTVSAANTYVAAQGLGVVIGSYETSSTVNVAARTMTVKAYTGSFRFATSHAASGGIATSNLQIFLNGVLQGSWSTTSTVLVGRVIDLNIVPNDVVEWRHNVSTATESSIFSNPIESGSDAYVEQPLYILATEQ